MANRNDENEYCCTLHFGLFFDRYTIAFVRSLLLIFLSHYYFYRTDFSCCKLAHFTIFIIVAIFIIIYIGFPLFSNSNLFCSSDFENVVVKYEKCSSTIAKDLFSCFSLLIRCESKKPVIYSTSLKHAAHSSYKFSPLDSIFWTFDFMMLLFDKIAL